MALRLNDVMKVLNYGGSVRVRAEAFDASGFMQLAGAVQEKSSLVIVGAAGMDSDNMATMASKSLGRVVFDLT